MFIRDEIIGYHENYLVQTIRVFEKAYLLLGFMLINGIG
jgi:hypothetical protein